ncbi:MAG TPA: tetratricopeptide repeat protein [Cyclobacteriaceae bacterium]|nr:tetratricopeptide repeat protein [Cyclobacteriaceae bacterium]
MGRLLNIFLVLFFAGLCASAGPADSLEMLIKEATSDNDKARLLLRLTEVYGLNGGVEYLQANRRILILRNNSNRLIIAKANENIGDYYWLRSAMDSVRYYYNKSLTEYLSENKISNTGTILYKLAQVYNQSANYKAALQYANEAFDKFKSTDDQPNLANIYALLCDIQSKMGLKEKAINNCITSLKIYDETGRLQGKPGLLNSIGNIYLDLKQLDKCDQYFREALALARANNNRPEIAGTLNNLADTFLERFELDSAYDYYGMALEIQQEDGNLNQLAATYLKIGKADVKAGDNLKALFHLQEGLKYVQQSPDNEIRARLYSELGNVYSNLGNLRLAINYLKRALADAQRVDSDPILQSCYNNLAKYYDLLGDEENALVYFKLYMLHREYMFDNQSALKIAEIEALYNLEKKEKEIQLLKSENRIKDLEASSRKLINIVLVTGLIIVIAFSVIIYRQFRIQNKANLVLSMQKEAIDLQKKEIEKQRDNIKESNIMLEDKNMQITDSIEYAKRIQFSLLPDQGFLKSVFPSSFMIHIPKDIVSGDFYYLGEVGQVVYIAAIDCTGHGVPGAFMTVLAHGLLSQVLSDNAILSPDKIISDLDKKVRLNLNQHGISLSPFEGMDMGLLQIDRKQNTISYSGAKIPVYHFNGSELLQIEPDRYSIGGNGIENKSFTRKSISYNPGDILYLSTDGYQDQFGGHNGKKFMKLHFRNLLNEVARLPIQEQENALVSIFNKWKSDNPQTDDVLILGLQL